MKVYVKAVVSLEKLREQFAPDMKESLFEELVAVDPTANYATNKGGKYCPWIFRQYKANNLTEDDFINLHDALAYFSKNGKRFPEADIGRYKTVKDFLDTETEVINRPLTEEERLKMERKRAHRASDEDKKFLVAEDNWEVWQPLTWAGSQSLARTGGVKAEWCTAYSGGDYHWRNYSRQGPLYIFLNMDDPNEKYQTHFESNSYMFDVSDHPRGPNRGKDFFFQFCKEHPKIGAFFDVKVVDGVEFRAGNVMGFQEGAKYIKVPESVLTINKRFPSSAEEIYIPDSVSTISGRAFEELHDLKKVRLPNTLTNINASAFRNCSSLTSIDIPDSVTEYGDYAFSGCTSLTRIKNSNNLKKIGDYCFDGCEVLTDFKLPDTVESLGKQCFRGTGFTDFDMPAGITVLGSVFYNDKSIERVNLNNVTTIYQSAFNSSSIEEIDLSNVDNIGSSAFRDCERLVSVTTLKEGVHLGSSVFADNPNLMDVTLPAGCELGIGVFDYCTNLTLRWEAEDQPYEFDDIALLICDGSCKELIKANKGYVKIQTLQGDIYEVQ